MLVFCCLLVNRDQTPNPCNNMSWYLRQCSIPTNATFQMASYKNPLTWKRKTLNRAH